MITASGSRREKFADRRVDRGGLLQGRHVAGVLDLHELGLRQTLSDAAHLVGRARIVREDRLLETGGSVKNALPLLGDGPFFILNGDGLWRDGPAPMLSRMEALWDPARMDALLLATAIVVIAGVWYFSRARLGYALRVIGEDEMVARHSGIDTTRVKVLVFALTASVIALTGAILSLRYSYIDPKAAA